MSHPVSDFDSAAMREGDIIYQPGGTAYISAPALDTAAGTESGSVLAQVSDSDSGTGTDAQSLVYAVQAVSSSDAGAGAETWSVFARKSDSDSGAAVDAQVLLYAPSDADAGTGSDQSAPIIVYSWMPAWMFLPGLRVVWHPEYETIRLADSLNDVSDSDFASGSESCKPVATVVQFAVAPQVSGRAVGG